MPEGTPQGTELFEIMHSMRAMRRLKPDPVPDELIRNILLAGQAAASGGNTPRWRLLGAKDPAMKKAEEGHFKKAFHRGGGAAYGTRRPPPRAGWTPLR